MRLQPSSIARDASRVIIYTNAVGEVGWYAPTIHFDSRDRARRFAHGLIEYVSLVDVDANDIDDVKHAAEVVAGNKIPWTNKRKRTNGNEND